MMIMMIIMHHVVMTVGTICGGKTMENHLCFNPYYILDLYR